MTVFILLAITLAVGAFGSTTGITNNKIVVLITGCSSGIGKSTALEFAKDPKYKVWASMRSTDAWDVAVSGNIATISMDVTSDDSVSKAVSTILATDGHIDILINNAGFGLAGALEVVHIEEAKALFDVNVWGAVRMLQAVLPSMRRRRAGYVINISSTSGIRGIPCMEFYTGSKFALEGITDSMRYSLAPYNISVTNLNAGPVRTAFTGRYGIAQQGGRGTRVVDGDDGYLQSLTDRIAAGLQARIDSPDGQTAEEVGRLLVNLASMKFRQHGPPVRLTDLPFNIGSSYDSQRLLEQVLVQPTGWGDGVYNQILDSVPPLSEASNKKDEL